MTTATFIEEIRQDDLCQAHLLDGSTAHVPLTTLRESAIPSPNFVASSPVVASSPIPHAASSLFIANPQPPAASSLHPGF